jgi:hypothetical protein
MGQCHEIFCFCFFHESIPPSAQSIQLGPFQFFSKICGDISKVSSQVKVHHQYQRHRWQICQQCQQHWRQNCRWYQQHRRKIFPQVSMTPVANFAASFASVVDTGGKFATGVNDTGGKFATGINDSGGK